MFFIEGLGLRGSSIWGYDFRFRVLSLGCRIRGKFLIGIFLLDLGLLLMGFLNGILFLI